MYYVVCLRPGLIQSVSISNLPKALCRVTYRTFVCDDGTKKKKTSNFSTLNASVP